MPTPKRMTGSRLAALASTAVDLSGNEPPKEFRIFKAGVIETTKGAFVFDAEAAADVMDAYQRHGVDLVIDYDHHSLSTSQGVKAIAAGWFSLELRDGDLWATGVRWTPTALEHFAKGEYRYFSPVFDFERSSLRITNVINNALTNTPAMDGIEALIAASATTEDSMDPELKKALERITALETAVSEKDRTIATLQGQTATVALAATLGLSAGAGDAEVRTTVAALTTFRKQVLDTLGKGDEATALGALTVLKTKAAEVETLQGKLVEQERVALSAEWSGYLDELSTKGKGGKYLTPAQRPEVEKHALKFGGGALNRAAVDFGKELALGFLTAMGAPSSAGQFSLPSGISRQQSDINRRMGIKDEEFAKTFQAGAGR